MKMLLATLHVALVSTVLFPVYLGLFLDDSMLDRRTITVPVPWRTWSSRNSQESLPLEEALRAIYGRPWMRSVVAAGLPAFLAFLNLPLILRLKGRTGARWRALSSLILGLLSTAFLAQLLPRYGFGREWGGWVIWSLSLLLLVAGLAALVRLRPAEEERPAPT